MFQADRSYSLAAVEMERPSGHVNVIAPGETPSRWAACRVERFATPTNRWSETAQVSSPGRSESLFSGIRLSPGLAGASASHSEGSEGVDSTKLDSSPPAGRYLVFPPSQPPAVPAVSNFHSLEVS